MSSQISAPTPLVLGDILNKSGLAEFTRNIRLGKFERSYDVAKKTVVILNQLVKENSWSTCRELIDILKEVCQYIDGLALVETAVGNMTRRVMRIIRDECHHFSVTTPQKLTTSSQQQQQQEPENNRDELEGSCLDLELNDETGLKDNILEGIEQELMNELELSSKSIAQQATDYVQSDEIILTLGRSKIIESFLRHAASGSKASKRKFSVIVVELVPFYSGREMAKSLTKCGIDTLIIPDSAVFAIMSRVNKVIIGTHSMMANGGIKAPASSHSIALAAKHYAVPVIVCCPMYKLTPEYLVSHDTAAFKRFSHLHAAYPEPYTPIARGDISGDREVQDKETSTTIESNPAVTSLTPTTTSLPSGIVESLHSTFDYVPPELITLFVSNIGGNSPSYVYQLLNELYYKSDYLD